MDIFFDIHKDLPREGPGDNHSTGRAFSLITGLPDLPRILDIGCGPGMQTRHLARISGGTVTAVDTHAAFLEVLAQRAAEEGLGERITTLQMSMSALDLGEDRFDVIWSEGAIYIMGFAEGLRAWRNWLKPGGWVAVTELSWLKSGAPQEIWDYWRSEYPGIKTIEENLALVRQAGYRDAAHFTLPRESWLTDYYIPLEKRMAALREKYSGNPTAMHMLDENQREVEMFRKYSDWYGYVFYVMQAMGDVHKQ